MASDHLKKVNDPELEDLVRVLTVVCSHNEGSKAKNDLDPSHFAGRDLLHYVSFLLLKKRWRKNQDKIESRMKEILASILKENPFMPTVWCHFSVWADTIAPISLPNLVFTTIELENLRLPDSCYKFISGINVPPSLNEREKLLAEILRLKTQRLFYAPARRRRPAGNLCPSLPNCEEVDVDDYQNPNPRKFFY